MFEAPSSVTKADSLVSEISYLDSGAAYLFSNAASSVGELPIQKMSFTLEIFLFF